MRQTDKNKKKRFVHRWSQRKKKKHFCPGARMAVRTKKRATRNRKCAIAILEAWTRPFANMPTHLHTCSKKTKTQSAALPILIYGDQARLKFSLRISDKNYTVFIVSELEHLIPTIEFEQLGGTANSPVL